jgi:hypothetical protein
MKTWKILDSEDRVLTFTFDENVYTLYGSDEEQTIILQAVDDENGFTFMDDICTSMDYCDIDYMHLFLNLIGRIDNKLYGSYIITEPIGQI